MSYLTYRQFIDWPPAMLAVELSRGKPIKSWNVRRYMLCRRYLRDNIFVEKFSILVKNITEMEQNRHLICELLRIIDELPHWMFASFVTTMLSSYDIFSNGHYYALEHINRVDNIVFCLLKGMGVRCINWNKVYPLDKVWILRPWFLTRDVYSIGVVIDEDHIKAVMGEGKPYQYTFYDFCTVKDVAMYGRTPHVWHPKTSKDFEGFAELKFDKIINEGWFVVLDMGRLNNIILLTIHRIITKHRCSYQLYDKAFKYGPSNRVWYRAIREVDVAADKQSALYPVWRQYVEALEQS